MPTLANKVKKQVYVTKVRFIGNILSTSNHACLAKAYHCEILATEFNKSSFCCLSTALIVGAVVLVCTSIYISHLNISGVTSNTLLPFFFLNFQFLNSSHSISITAPSNSAYHILPEP